MTIFKEPVKQSELIVPVSQAVISKEVIRKIEEDPLQVLERLVGDSIKNLPKQKGFYLKFGHYPLKSKH